MEFVVNRENNDKGIHKAIKSQSNDLPTGNDWTCWNIEAEYIYRWAKNMGEILNNPGNNGMPGDWEPVIVALIRKKGGAKYRVS